VTTRKRQGRVAGLLYLALAVTSTVGLSIPGSFMVRGDAAATAAKLALHEMFYRLCIVSDVASQVIFVFLVLAFFRLLRGVNERLAVLMVALVLVQVPMVFATTLVAMAPLAVLHGPAYWSSFDQHQLDAATMGFLRLREIGISAVTALWGLWLLPLGLLVFRSAFIPRFLGVMLIVACFADLAVSVVSLLLPAYEHTIQPLRALGVGEILLILWLLIKGARTESADDRQPSPA
jgi:Domain of unknown function (DUF4386)